MSRAFAVCIGFAVAILTGVLGWEMTSSAGVAARPAAPATVGRVLPDAVRAPAPLPRDLATALLARPLFEPSRRPPATAFARTTVVAAAIPRVTGVLVGPVERSAIFAPGGDNVRQVIAREGARVGVFTVQSIRAGEVTVVGPDGPITLRPSYDPNQRVERPAPPSPPPLTGVPGLPVRPSGPVGRFGLPSLPGLPAPPATTDPPR